MPQLLLEPIRRAVNAGEFDRAQFLWNECAAAVTDELGNGRFTEARLTEVREFVEWSRNVVLCERTRMLNRLNSLHVAAEYEDPVAPPAHRLVEASF